MAERRNILVVDDEPDVLEQIVELLESRYELVLAATFDEAVAAFAKKKPDVCILDIMGVNGEELLVKFQKQAPCIMLTAHALSPAHLKKSAASGARLYLPKDELLHMPDYIEQVLQNPGKPLWRWLLERLSFRRWFGAAWKDEDDQWLLDITIEDIERDLKSDHYER